MGFPYSTSDWSVIFADDASGVMFMGWGGAAPGLYTFFAAVICVAVLWQGNKTEHEKYNLVEK
jgi:hypothetical protein